MKVEDDPEGPTASLGRKGGRKGGRVGKVCLIKRWRREGGNGKISFHNHRGREAGREGWDGVPGTCGP